MLFGFAARAAVGATNVRLQRPPHGVKMYNSDRRRGFPEFQMQPIQESCQECGPFKSPRSTFGRGGSNNFNTRISWTLSKRSWAKKCIDNNYVLPWLTSLSKQRTSLLLFGLFEERSRIKSKDPNFAHRMENWWFFCNSEITWNQNWRILRSL